MRSNTLTPLLQFFNWWGIEPYRANGIDRYNNIKPSRSSKDDCFCMLQHPWQAQSQWSRDDLIQMLQYAETTFTLEAGFHPAPFQVRDEPHRYNSKNGIIRKDGLLKSVMPDYNCKLIDFGTKYYESLGFMELTRDDENGILDTFSFQIVVPSGTLPESIKVYFTITDGRPNTGLEPHKFLEWQIRPLSIRVDDITATISGGAYLFKKPELDEENTCVEHALDTYVSEVEVFVEQINKCNQGYFVCEAGSCQGYNCENIEQSICFNKRYIAGGYWGVPSPLSCNDEGVLVPYCISCRPQQVNMNYITGYPLDENGYMNNMVFKTIALLGITLADCIKSWCVCDMCVTDKIKYYRSYEMIKVAEGVKDGAIGDQFRHFITDQTKTLISGLPPYRGLVEAFRNIQTLGCRNISGHIIGDS